MRRILLVTALAACGVRTPAAVDVDAILRAQGPQGARIDLEAAVLASPRDVGARLALAALAERLGRPSEAIAQLETVIDLGGPLGIRWHAEDRTRLARLIAARGRVRLARGAAAAAADLERARSLGAVVTDAELRRAHIAAAIVDLRHIDAGVREHGARILAFLDEPQWHGARPNATLAERGAFGAWLWSIGAKRGAWVELSAWHDRTPAPRDPRLQAAYATARIWWTPVDEPIPANAEGQADRCALVACEPARTPLAPVDAHAAFADPLGVAVVRATRARLDGSDAVDAAQLAPIVAAFRRDPAVAERLGRDLVASSADAAIAHATIGALFEALGDPARARLAWQAAFDASPEPAFAQGLAEIQARAGDPDAAMITASTAAAASGDPAVSWVAIARALHESGAEAIALEAARSAIDLATADTIDTALDIAIAASHALGRDAQAAQLAQRRPAPRTDELTEALAAHREAPSSGTLAALWVASRQHPRDLDSRAEILRATDSSDPRHAAVVVELVDLAADRALAAAALQILRQR